MKPNKSWQISLIKMEANAFFTQKLPLVRANIEIYIRSANKILSFFKKSFPHSSFFLYS